MAGIPILRGGRRSPLPPAPLHGEVVRSRLIDALDARFDVDLTVLVAGAGFGKTTALAQALRANDAAPRGIDAWVACEPGDEDAQRLAAAIVDALGGAPGPGEPAEQVVDALKRLAPVDVCLVLDDLHELPTGSPGETLVVDLAARLPAHAHLVLASRVPVPVPLARRRAAGQVAELDAEQLAFTDTEVEALSKLVGGENDACLGLAGWPSLVRLVLSAPVGATRQFLWEEIVLRLEPVERTGLLALATLGSATAAEVAAVAGQRIDVDQLVTRVPLLHRDREDRFGAHHLWEEAAIRIFAPAEVMTARRRALEVMAARGDTVSLGAAAARWLEAPAFQEACVALVREGLGAFPIETGARWLADAPPAAAGTAEVRLLEVALRHAQQRDQPDVDRLLDELAAEFAVRREQGAEMVTVALASWVAHARGDALRMLTLAERARARPIDDREPLLQFFLDAVDAALASLRGDIAEAVRILSSVSYERVPPRVAELVVRLHVVMLTLAGRADETAVQAERLLSSRNGFVRLMPTMMRWSRGDPTGYLAAPPDAAGPADLNDRDRLVHAAHVVGVACSFGDADLLASVSADALSADVDRDPRDSAMVAVASALTALAHHDESAAAAAIGAHLDRHPLHVALGEAHLRRHVTVPYLLDERVRTHWDATALGPQHQRALAAARKLLAGRAGALDPSVPLDDPAFVLAVLPLPWSVELAAHAHGVGHSGAVALMRALDGWLGGPARAELARLASSDARCATAAERLQAALPTTVGRPPLRVDLLGPLRLRVGDGELTGPDLRRARVRMLLGLLVLGGPQRRERIADLLWPALDANAAAQNLRVTLSRLRHLLRSGGDDRIDIWLVSQADRVGLAGPPLLVTDLETFRDAVSAATAARRTGDTAAEQAGLAGAVECWRGEPFADLDDLDEVRGDVERIRRDLVDAALRLGELLLVGGRIDDAVALAERVRVTAPYDERAHRLAIAGRLRSSDLDGLRAAVDIARRRLDELGIEPEATTQMVLRNAEIRLGGARVPAGPAHG